MNNIPDGELGKTLYAGFNEIFYKGEKLFPDVDDRVEYWLVRKRYLPTFIQKLYWDHKAKKGGFTYHFWSGKVFRASYNDINVKVHAGTSLPVKKGY